MRLDQASFTVFDVETTGLYPYSGDRICEIGAVSFELSKRSMKKFHHLIDPERPVSYGAFLVNGITKEMFDGKPTIDQILPSFLDFIKDSVLVAYNAGFDLGFIECALGQERHILNGYYIIDALKLARRLFPEAGRYSLTNLSRSLGIKVDEEHRALEDAITTCRVFKKELKLLQSQGIDTVEDIANLRIDKTAAVKLVKDYKVKLIEDAIREQRDLNITYRSLWNNKVTNRVITPKELQRGYDRSYVIAHCHLKNAERNFRLDCILEAKITK